MLLLHVHLALEGPDRVVEPLLKGLVFGIATQQRHGRVRVRVVERAHEQFARAVVALAKARGVGGLLGAHVSDVAALGAHEHAALVVEVLVEDVYVGKEHELVLSE